MSKKRKGKSKIGLVLVGGTMRSASIALIPQTIHQILGHNPDIVIASSGAVGSSLAWYANRPELPKQIWSQINSKVLSPLQWPMVNIDYLIDHLIAPHIDDNDIATLNSSPARVYVPITDYLSGWTVIFGNHTSAHFIMRNRQQWIQLLRAAKAMPLVYGKRITFPGIVGEFFDGPSSSSIELNIQRAFQLGANKVFVALNGSQSKKSKVFFSLWATAKKLNEPQIWNYYRITRYFEKKLRGQFQHTPYKYNIFYLPPPDTKLTDSSTDPKLFLEAMDLGRKNLLNNKSAISFLKNT